MNATETAKTLLADVPEKAREVWTKVRPGPADGHRSLPIRAGAEEIQRRWDDPLGRAAVLDGIPVSQASLSFGRQIPEWGLVVSVDLTLEQPVPGMAAQALAGKAVRRLKALVETGEVPTTAHNPSARPDAGEAAA
jgi:hypothetical protein